MSTENTAWTKLETILNKATPDLIESIKEDFKHDHVCIATYSQAIFQGGNVKSKLQGGIPPRDFMKQLGFTDEELEKNRLCIIGDCNYQDEICNLLNHMIGYHQMPIKNIASIIPAMATDKREPKKGNAKIVQEIKQTGKGTD